jgi:tetratricopeptide (TPR) repeat protein
VNLHAKTQASETGSHLLGSARTRHRFVFAALVILIAVTVLGWVCITDPKLNFLHPDNRAQWILFPAAVSGGVQRTVSLDAGFRRTFTLPQQPRTAELRVRAARRLELKINGAAIDIPTQADGNWKKPTKIDVAQFLRAGSNQIDARVFNDNGPPALCLTLSAGRFRLQTDPDWQSEFTGSAWRPAVLASEARFPGPGNPIAGGENTFQSVAIVWRTWLVLAAIAFAILLSGSFLLRSSRSSNAPFSTVQIVGVLSTAGLLWAILFWHNAQFMPVQEGFDSLDHVKYIQYVQQRWALPLPNEGAEMFQPPLYYVISAAALSGCHLLGLKWSSVLVLRCMTMLFGIAHFTLVVMTLRLVCPGSVEAPLAGLLLSAFLPLNLYLSQFVTNETLAAMLMSATIYLAGRSFEQQRSSLGALSIVGVLLGAAILTKATALVLIPALLLGVAVKLWKQKSKARDWLLQMATPLVVCFAVAGWHYIRIWYRMGSPLIGNWDVASGFPWWQDPGFRTTYDYLRFGRSLVAPLFSGFAGFWDGIYSTLWGDGLSSGAIAGFRAPWNYPLMVGGYLLALVPSVMILIGAIVVAYRSLRGGFSPTLAMLLGFCALMVFSVVVMTIRVPSYAQVKASYGLSMLVPMCLFGAVGWLALTRRYRLLKLIFGTLLLVFALNAFMSFWMPPGPSGHIYAGAKLIDAHHIEAADREIKQALQLEPSNPSAWRLRSNISNDINRPEKALQQIEHAVQLDPNQSQTRVQHAFLLRAQNQLERAIQEARQAVELGPENPFAYHVLTNCLLGVGRTEEAVEVARVGLAVLPYDSELHYQLALAAAQAGDSVSAINQLSYAFLIEGKDTPDVSEMMKSSILSILDGPDPVGHLRQAVASVPDYPEAMNELGWLLSTSPDDSLRNGPEAVYLGERACALTHSNNQQVLATLAAAYAEAGRFREAVSTAEKAASLAQARNDAATLSLSEKLLSTFRENRAFRDNPTRL